MILPLLVGGCLAAASEPALTVMPMPAKVSRPQGRLPIDSSFAVKISRYADRRLESAVARMVSRISRQTGLPIQGDAAKNGAPATLVIECRNGGPAIPTLAEDESYQLEITAAAARLSAATVTGALRGMETFTQLIAAGDSAFSAPAVRIEDKPRFAWRGLMMDVARHWMPVSVIERNLDAMAAVKLNVFHWHLSDDQGFRVESKLFPKLHQFGSDGDFYTQDQVRHIVAYAQDRGIRVVPEFDMPGHTTSWFAGYPELASAPGPYQIERRWGIFEPTMNPAREEVYSFLNAFIGEMARLFPDEYFHVGGDEVLDKQWKQNSAIQAFSARHGLKTGHDLQAYFNRRVQPIVGKHGKRMVGWDEILAPELAADSVIQSWRGQEALAAAAQKGYRGILSFGYYLDHLKPAAFHYAVDPLEGAARALKQDEAARILGGEACMWAEYASAETVDSRIWPRAAAIAERLWSPREINGIDSMYARLQAVSRRLDWVGTEHRSNYFRMLERLSGNSAQSLQVLADVVEPLGIEGRQKSRQYTSQTPLNRLVDAARPESEATRGLAAAARRFVEDPKSDAADRDSLRRILAGWQDNHSRLLPLLQTSFLLQEVVPLSEDLSQLGSMGIEALKYVESGRRAPQGWIGRQKELLDRIETPKAEVVLAAGRPVRILVEAAGERSAK